MTRQQGTREENMRKTTMQYDAFFSRLSCSGWQHVGVALVPLLLFKTFIPPFLAEGLHFSLFLDPVQLEGILLIIFLLLIVCYDA